MASGVANEGKLPHSPRKIAIEGILLPLAVANEFHGKCFLCVSSYFEIGASGSGSLPVVTGTSVGITVWTAVICDLDKGECLAVSC